jgi:hypothetical protein
LIIDTNSYELVSGCARTTPAHKNRLIMAGRVERSSRTMTASALSRARRDDLVSTLGDGQRKLRGDRRDGCSRGADLDCHSDRFEV